MKLYTLDNAMAPGKNCVIAKDSKTEIELSLESHKSPNQKISKWITRCSVLSNTTGYCTIKDNFQYLVFFI